MSLKTTQISDTKQARIFKITVQGEAKIWFKYAEALDLVDCA